LTTREMHYLTQAIRVICHCWFVCRLWLWLQWSLWYFTASNSTRNIRHLQCTSYNKNAHIARSVLMVKCNMKYKAFRQYYYF